MTRNGRKLTGREKAVNKAVCRLCYTVVRIYSSMHRRFDAEVTRYVGLAETHAAHYGGNCL